MARLTLKELKELTAEAAKERLKQIKDPAYEIDLDDLLKTIGVIRKNAEFQKNQPVIAAHSLSALDFISELRPFAAKLVAMTKVDVDRERGLARTERAPAVCEAQDIKPTVDALNSIVDQDAAYIAATEREASAKAFFYYLKDKTDELVMHHHLARQILAFDKKEQGLAGQPRDIEE